MGRHQGRCRVCRREVDGRLLRFAEDLDLDVLTCLHRANPTLEGRDPACPRCVEAAVSLVAAELGIEALHDRIQASWPIDPGTTYGVLPVPMRLHANPFYRGRGVTIAFLDSGFFPHPDLVLRRNRVRLYVDASTTGIRELPEVEGSGVLSWHGLMTSTVAAGDGACSGGRYRGLASEASLVLVKISDPQGGVHDVDIERGLTWVKRNHRRLGIQVVNLSVGGDEEQSFRDSPVDQLVSELVQAGVCVVAAAGNAGQRRLVPPASAPAAITVGGLDDQNLMDSSAYRIWHSNYGETVDGIEKPELVAPSIWVAAPILPETDQIPQAEALDRLANAPPAEIHGIFRRLGEVAGLHSGWSRRRPTLIRAAARRLQVREQFLEGAYKRVEGTSFAAPIVSSTAAVMLEAHPGLTPLRLKEILLRTAEKVPGVDVVRQGHGVVDPREAVARALRESRGPLDGLPLSPARDGRRVTFLFHAPGARPVAVVGGFNDWDPNAIPFRELRADVFAASVDIDLDRTWRYQYLLDDGTVIDDPENPRKEPDGAGGFVSKLMAT